MSSLHGDPQRVQEDAGTLFCPWPLGVSPCPFAMEPGAVLGSPGVRVGEPDPPLFDVTSNMLSIKGSQNQKDPWHSPFTHSHLLLELDPLKATTRCQEASSKHPCGLSAQM